MAHNFSFGSGTQPKQSTPGFSFGNAQTSHKKSNEPANTEFSFGSGVHQSTEPITNIGIPVNNQGPSVGFSFGSKSSNITLPQPATTTLTTQQQIERNIGSLATFSETSHQQNKSSHQQNQEEIARTHEFINKARGGFSFGNGQPSHQKVPGFSFGSADNQSSNRQDTSSTRQEKTEEEVVQLKKEVKLLRKKLKEIAIVEERVKQLEHLKYNKDVNVLLLGDSGVGKSSLVRKHLSGQFKQHHLATTEIEITSLQFHHNKGAISFQLWEIPEEVPNKDVMCTGADCAIIMFDVTSRSSYNNAVNVHTPAVRKVCGGIPIILLGNKVDIRSPNVGDVFLTYDHGDTKYYDMSVKECYNYAEPFLWLLRKLLRCDELDFVEGPVLRPPEFIFDEATKRKYEEELAAAANMPWPPDDDDEDL